MKTSGSCFLAPPNWRLVGKENHDQYWSCIDKSDFSTPLCIQSLLMASPTRAQTGSSVVRIQYRLMAILSMEDTLGFHRQQKIGKRQRHDTSNATA